MAPLLILLYLFAIGFFRRQGRSWPRSILFGTLVFFALWFLIALATNVF